jgi:hypothetical protein
LSRDVLRIEEIANADTDETKSLFRSEGIGHGGVAAVVRQTLNQISIYRCYRAVAVLLKRGGREKRGPL